MGIGLCTTRDKGSGESTRFESFSPEDKERMKIVFEKMSNSDPT